MKKIILIVLIMLLLLSIAEELGKRSKGGIKSATVHSERKGKERFRKGKERFRK